MNKAHRTQSTRIWFGLAVISLLGGLVFMGVTIWPVAGQGADRAGTSARRSDPEDASTSCELLDLVEVDPPLDPRVEAVCAIALGVADRIRIGTITLPFDSREGHIVTEGRVVARHGRCGPDGLALALIIKPLFGTRRRPVLSAYEFVDRWIEGVAAWGVDPFTEPAISELRVAWDEGHEPGRRPRVRVAGHWQYLPVDGGIRGDVVYEAETILFEQIWSAPPHAYAVDRRRWRFPSSEEVAP
ncbi:MAG: hypothetical protein WBM75_09225 [Polyangiales bacterium]